MFSKLRARSRLLARILAVLAALAVAATAVLVGALWLAHRQPVTLPAPAGPYAVGRVAYDWTDAARTETLGGAPGKLRELMVWVWYPAEAGAGEMPAEYLPAAWAAARERDLGPGALLWQQAAAVRSHALADVPVAQDERPFPLLIFSTGYGALPADYTVLAEDLASHGYVVAGIANTYSAPVVVFPDGRTALRSPAGALPEDAPPGDTSAEDRLLEVWARDARFAIDQMARLNEEPGGHFSGRIDLGRIGLLGHSFGVATSAEVCRTDERCRAGLDIDGDLLSAARSGGVNKPFMFITEAGSADEMARLRSQFGPTLGNGATWITIDGTGHFSFRDAAVQYAPLLRAFGGLGSIDGSRGLAITRAYVRAFFDRHFKEIQGALPDGPSAEYPEVKFIATQPLP